jgi:glutamate-1-semialdehyde 2,1-aminomutase
MAATVRNTSLDDALERVEARYRGRNPRSAARHDAARDVLPGGNTRTVLHFSPFPITVVKGEGAVLHSLDGHAYVDFLNEYTAGLYGHSNPIILDAVKQALEEGYVFGAPNLFEARLAELICERFPSCDRVRMCNSGTEANVNAIGLARAFTERQGVLVFRDGYHGGVLTFAGDEPSKMNVPYDFVFADYNETEQTRKILRDNADRLACVIVEPMMGAAGAIVAERPFLQMLREETRDLGILLIFDEVMTSRLGPSGLQGKFEVIPDLTTFGKYVGGGMTFGAFGGRAEVMDLLDPSRPDALLHSGTYNNNVLTMAAGVAGLTKVLTPDVVATFNAQGDELRENLNAIARRRNVPVQVTGEGSIMCIHLHDHPVTSPASAKLSDARARALFHLEMLERGYYLARRGFISLALPLSKKDYDGFAKAFDDVVMLLGPYLHAEPALKVGQ